MSKYSGAVIIPARNEDQYIQDTLVAISQQQVSYEDEKHAVVIVDNGSSDRTLEVASKFSGHTGIFDMFTVIEPEPGISSACNSGFNFAVNELGANVIARLDADTRPMQGWYDSLLRKFAFHPKTAIVTGPVFPGLENDKAADRILVPAARAIGNLIKVFRYRELAMFCFASGYNMATTSAVFKTVDGFSVDSGITDDVDFNLKVAEEFGWTSFGYSRAMRVATSQRRLRELGYIGAAKYYLTDAVHPPKE